MRLVGVTMSQTTFSGLAWATKGKVTRRERFLSEMDAVIPWARLLALIEPHYPSSGQGRPPIGLERMLRVYFVQQWFNLSDPQAEDSLYDSESIRRFVGIELSHDRVPDETTILRFRHLLEEHRLTEQMFTAVRSLLEERGLLMKSGTIVDATILSAPSSTKNKSKSRDPEMKQTRKGNQWYFGMKAHIGTDPKGIVHSLVTTNAAAGDITQMPALLHGEERSWYGDRAYWCERDRKAARSEGIRYRIQQRAKAGHPLTAHQRTVNRSRSRVRSRGEHPFHVVKRLWGHAKVRYRGLAKNTSQLFSLFALSNLYLLRHRLRPA